MKKLSNENECFRKGDLKDSARGDLKDNIMGCWLLHCNLSFPRQPLGVTHVNTLPEWSCESRSIKFSKSQKSPNDFDFKPFWHY